MKHTVSLTTAQKLKEKGFNQNTYFEWFDYHGKISLEHHVSNEFHGEDDKNYCAAPISDEILEVLPQVLKIKGTTYQLFISMGLDRQYFLVYADELDYNNNAPFPIKMTHVLAEAAGEMYLYLDENNLLPEPLGKEQTKKGGV